MSPYSSTIMPKRSFLLKVAKLDMKRGVLGCEVGLLEFAQKRCSVQTFTV